MMLLVIDIGNTTATCGIARRGRVHRQFAIATQPRDDFRGCPQCRTALEEITGGQVPDGLHIDTCHTCYGLWFDRGELLIYKSGLEAKRKTMRTKEIEASRKRSINRRRMATKSVAHVMWRRGGVIGALDGLADLTTP